MKCQALVSREPGPPEASRYCDREATEVAQTRPRGHTGYGCAMRLCQRHAEAYTRVWLKAGDEVKRAPL